MEAAVYERVFPAEAKIMPLALRSRKARTDCFGEEFGFLCNERGEVFYLHSHRDRFTIQI